MAECHPAEPRLGFLLDEDVEHLYSLCPRFELVINLKTAKALALTIPPTLLGRTK